MTFDSPTSLDTLHATYTYDATGQRTQSIVTPAGGTATTTGMPPSLVPAEG